MTASPRVLVTGVAGFIGSHVADHCLQLGLEVVGVDDLSGGSRRNIPQGVDFIEGDLRDAEFVRNLARGQKWAAIYHLAAYAAEGLSHFVRRHNYQTNLLASVNLLNLAIEREVQTFVFASSLAVYGHAQSPVTEDIAPHPEDPYGVAKYAFELDLQAAHRVFGLNYVIFRPHNVYGPRQNILDPYRNVVGIFMNQTLHGQPMTVFGDGLQTRAFSYIDEVAPVIAHAPFRPAALNRTFNLGSDTAYTVVELAHAVAHEFGVPARIHHLEPRPEVLHLTSDHTRARSVFALPQPIPLREGLAQMAAWVRTQGAGTPTRFSAIEIERGLPKTWKSS